MADSKSKVALWKKQKGNIFNNHLVHRNDTFDDSIHEEEKIHKINDNFYQAASFADSELQCYIHAFLLNNAIASQNKLACDPYNEEFNEEFFNAQMEFRNWRGKYLFEKFKEKEELANVYAAETYAGDPATYYVEFTIREIHDIKKNTTSEKVVKINEEITKNTVSASVSYDDIDLDKIKPLQILHILKQAKTISEKINGDWLTDSEINEILMKIEVDFTNGSSDNNELYFLGAPFRETSRYATPKKGMNDIWAGVNGMRHSYQFHINRFMPSQDRLYENPVVVQKMINDFVTLPIPPSHVDLAVKYNIGENHHILTWTIHKLKGRYHNAINVTQLSSDTGYFLPPKLSEIEITEVKDDDIIVSQHLLHSDVYNKHNLLQLLDLHAGMIQQHDFKFGLSKSHTEKRGYVYEFSKHYTVVFNTWLRPFAGTQDNLTSYTIIYWNPLISKNNGFRVTNNTNNVDSAKVRALEQNLSVMSRQFSELYGVYQELVPYTNQVRFFAEQDYFVPGILDIEYANSDAHDRTQPMGGYLISKPDMETRIKLEAFRKKLQRELLPEFERILNFTGITEIKNITHEITQGNARHTIPGYFGQFLAAVHRVEGYETLLPSVKKWTIAWNEYLTQLHEHPMWKPESEFSEIAALIREKNKILKSSANQQQADPFSIYSTYARAGTIVNPQNAALYGVSQENIDVMRQYYDRMGRGEFGGGGIPNHPLPLPGTRPRPTQPDPFTPPPRPPPGGRGRGGRGGARPAAGGRDQAVTVKPTVPTTASGRGTWASVTAKTGQGTVNEQRAATREAALDPRLTKFQKSIQASEKELKRLEDLRNQQAQQLKDFNERLKKAQSGAENQQTAQVNKKKPTKEERKRQEALIKAERVRKAVQERAERARQAALEKEKRAIQAAAQAARDGGVVFRHPRTGRKTTGVDPTGAHDQMNLPIETPMTEEERRELQRMYSEDASENYQEGGVAPFGGFSPTQSAQSQFKNDIDNLKRTVNELVLRSQYSGSGGGWGLQGQFENAWDFSS